MPHDPSKQPRGPNPLAPGVKPPAAAPSSPKTTPALVVIGALLAASGAVGCAAESAKQTYDPVAVGMTPATPPFIDQGDTTLYEVKRAISLPIVVPTEAEMAALGTVVPPYTRTPWITNKDVKVQVSWTLSNLDGDPHNVEVLLDPWNEFARYVPGISVGEEETVPDLSGIDLLLRVEAKSRKKGIFTFDDMDEVATDLATAQNIIGMSGAGTGTMDDEVNGLVNHAFEIHNRSIDDKLVKGYIPATIAGLVGFDIGLRMSGQGNVGIEIVVEVTDVAGNRVTTDERLKIDGSMWITPLATLTAPMAQVR